MRGCVEPLKAWVSGANALSVYRPCDECTEMVSTFSKFIKRRRPALADNPGRESAQSVRKPQREPGRALEQLFEQDPSLPQEAFLAFLEQTSRQIGAQEMLQEISAYRNTYSALVPVVPFPI
jgi:hypothetical protein